MPSLHWTYDDSSTSSNDLAQGDILEPSADLLTVLRDVHSYFVNDKYLGYVVLTHSCDLVRRHGECRAHHICVAPFRSVEDVLPDLLDAECDPIVPGVYRKNKKSAAEQLLHRILNQNEAAMGLFYLHKSSDAGVDVPSVATLRVVFSLRRSHYETCLAARRGRLKDVFQAKLGWLISNLYGRVGTPDWPEGEKKRLTGEFLAGCPAAWESDAAVKAAQAAGADLSALPKEEAIAAIHRHKGKDPLDDTLDAIDSILRGLELPPELIKTAIRRIKQDVVIRTAFKSR